MGDRPYTVVVRTTAGMDLDGLRAFDRRRIEATISTALGREPFQISRNRKPLPGVSPGFEYSAPLWELRVGEFRVFYDGNEQDRTVYVGAVHHKPPGKTTEDITR